MTTSSKAFVIMIDAGQANHHHWMSPAEILVQRPQPPPSAATKGQMPMASTRHRRLLRYLSSVLAKSHDWPLSRDTWNSTCGNGELDEIASPLTLIL